MNQSRFLPLDVLRAIAIGLVLGRHILWIPENSSSWVIEIFLGWRRFGWIGVDLFFVLSGFLVGGLLIQEALQQQNILPIRFLVRRGLKIYPAFYAFLILSVLLAHLIGLRFSAWPMGVFSEVFFLQSYWSGLWPHTWSLAVEEHFYLLLIAFFCIAQKRVPARNRLAWLPFVILMINGAILIARLYVGFLTKAHWSALLGPTHLRLDSLFFGVLLAYYYHCQIDKLQAIHHALFRWRFFFLPLLLGPCLLLDLESHYFVTTIGLTSLYLGFGWIVIDALLGPTKDLLSRLPRFVRAIGRHSYSIYLWHVTVYYLLIPAILHWAPRTPFWVASITYLLAAVMVGMGLSWTIEQPVLRWRDRVIPSRRKTIERPDLFHIA